MNLHDETLMNNLNDGLYILDTNRTIIFWNKAAEKITGYSAKEVVGKSCSNNILVHIDNMGNNLCLTGCPMLAVMNSRQIVSREVFLHSKGGHRIPVKVTGIPYYDSDGNILGAIEIFQNASEKMYDTSKLKVLAKLSYTDPETALLNSQYASLHIESLKSIETEHSHPFGVLMLSFDNAFYISETYGNSGLTLANRAIAGNLQENLEGIGIPIRWEEDSFMVLIEEADSSFVAHLVQKLKMLLAATFVDYDGSHIIPIVTIEGILSEYNESKSNMMLRLQTKLHDTKLNKTENDGY